MKLASVTRIVVGLATVAGSLCLYSPSFAADAEAAQALARKNGCLKCHGVDKEKDGPAYTAVAKKYKGKPEAEQRLYTHLTTGEKAKFADGHEEEHKIIKATPEETKNLVQWILSL